MATYIDQRLFPGTAEQVFALIADVERYPEFVPGWRAAHVRERMGNVETVQQTLSIAGYDIEFVSQTRLEPPTRAEVVSQSGPLRRLRIEWRLRPVNDNCMVELSLDFEAHSAVLDGIAHVALDAWGRRILDAFEARACSVRALTRSGT